MAGSGMGMGAGSGMGMGSGSGMGMGAGPSMNPMMAAMMTGKELPESGDFYKLPPMMYQPGVASEVVDTVPGASSFMSSLGCQSGTLMTCGTKRDLYGNQCLWNGMFCIEPYTQINSDKEAMYCRMHQTSLTCTLSKCLWMGTMCMDSEMDGGSMIFLPPIASNSVPSDETATATTTTPSDVVIGLQLQKVQYQSGQGSEESKHAPKGLIALYICLTIGVMAVFVVAMKQRHDSFRIKSSPSQSRPLKYVPIELDLENSTPENINAVHV